MNEELEAKGFITIVGRVAENTMKKNFMVWRRMLFAAACSFFYCIDLNIEKSV